MTLLRPDTCASEAGETSQLPSARWQVAGTLDEQRAYPRISLHVPVAFRNGAGEHCAARLCNLSPDGMQVRCNATSAQIIHPQLGRLQPGNLPILQATAVLPMVAGQETLTVGVRLLYLTQAPEPPACILGFQFLALRPKARRIVDTFFEEQLRRFFAEGDSFAA